jgi:hypothetical protein
MARMIIALVLSVFMAGLGIAYEGDLELGVGLILLWLMLCLVAVYSTGVVSMISAVMALAIWSYSIFKTFFISVSD